jgi:hypothetical protein
MNNPAAAAARAAPEIAFIALPGFQAFFRRWGKDPEE